MKLSCAAFAACLAIAVMSSQAKDVSQSRFLRAPNTRHQEGSNGDIVRKMKETDGPMKFEMRPVTPAAVDSNYKNRRLNIAYQFVVNGEKTSGGKEWCMEAPSGLDIGKSMLLRPCKFQEADLEQLWDWDGRKIRHWLDDDKCLVVEDGEGTVEDGDRVRIGSCSKKRAEFVYRHGINSGGRGGDGGRIQVKSNTDLCLTFEGNNPDDDDRIMVKDCGLDNSDAVHWVFRTGWYEIGSGDECMVVRNGDISSGNRAIWDECDDVDAYARHWRIDEDGLFHVRKNEDYCLAAEKKKEGSAIRIQRCNKESSRQAWDWGDFEAPIRLRGTSLYVDPQGNNDDEGDPMVLEETARGWSGDSVVR